MQRLPDDGWAGSEVKSILERAVSQRQRNEISRAVGGVAVVQNQSVWIGRFENDLDVCERQQGPTKTDVLQVGLAAERRDVYVHHCERRQVSKQVSEKIKVTA